MSAGVSTRWLWVAIVALVACMGALAGAWMMMPGVGTAHAAGTSPVTAAKESIRKGLSASPAAAQGIQAPEHMDSFAGSGIAQSSTSGLGISPVGSVKLTAR
ncbi:hypothetical protein G7047_24790 [Diaphorobacter sp. HDW4A]|uniref:hypothetical protein n=1 Tax=Diaphorobacter sp. HDW4A TaxID=2714924 RepID=UPI001409E1E8|nr:hypothetical protein [Diaphorobacter sp. HDW4A]QIL82796.1 hypothetical protein G7047_24790 [Diaphorobacter sp. HDW4A]